MDAGLSQYTYTLPKPITSNSSAFRDHRHSCGWEQVVFRRSPTRVQFYHVITSTVIIASAMSPPYPVPVG